MALHKLWIIPFLTFIFSLLAFFVAYIVAMLEGHVDAFWPYISDGGTFPPDSCIFAQLMNMSALFLAVSAYLRHRQIVEFYRLHHKEDMWWRKVTVILLWFGYASAFGVSIVANFQETNVLIVHYFGALLAFFCGLIYAWSQTVFSYLMNPKLAGPIVSHLRLFLNLLATVFFITMIIFGPILGKPPRNYNASENKRNYHWTGEENNFTFHIIGTISEWCLAICFEIYILSFAHELRFASCHAPKLRLKGKMCLSGESTPASLSSTITKPFTLQIDHY